MNRRTHKKASDVFSEHEPFIGRKVSFAEAFPTIQTITVKVQEGDSWNPIEFGERIYSKDEFGEYIDCHNDICYKGGFSIGQILRKMVETKQTVFETSVGCQGFEGSPSGRKKDRICLHQFKVSVHIVFKN